MKNLINAISSFRFVPRSEATNYRKMVVDEKGNEVIVDDFIEDSEVNSSLRYEDFKLKNLLSSGINPELNHIDTSSFNRLSEITSFDSFVNDNINSLNAE